MSVCPFEQRHGRPCLLCRHAGSGVAEHAATHPAHLDVAEAADRIAAQQLYAERGLHLLSMEVEALPAVERSALDTWAAADAPLAAPFAARAHRAGPVVMAETPLQACTRCHLVLQDHAAVVEDGAYPVGAYVGLDCDGRPVAEEGPRA